MIELVGGVLIVLGLFTDPVAFILAGGLPAMATTGARLSPDRPGGRRAPGCAPTNGREAKRWPGAPCIGPALGHTAPT
jgi:hypothetical protein